MMNARARHLSMLAPRGFTLVEMMVTLVLLSLVVATIYASFGSQLKNESREEQVADMQMNARAAMDRLAWIFRHAGFGCRESFKTYNATLTDDNGTSFSRVFTIVDRTPDTAANSSDEVTVVLGFKKVGEVDGLHENTKTIKLKNVGTPTITTAAMKDFKSYLAFHPYPDNAFFRVTGISAPSYTLDKTVDTLLDETDVYMVAPIRIHVDANRTLLLENYAYTTASDWEVADGIEKLQFQYTTDDNGTTWSDDPADPGAIKAVRVWLLARAEHPDRNYTNTKTYTMAGVTFGPYNDGYHRLLMTTTVWLRNMNE
ncbi:prepilin-type N-terminal cleavage/methylation domain-containing protein [Dissulfurirhabdus thermomarina]|uniref:Prepilin-type N-terminal cleavage/methylation domain-containing protein n=1 Tax=Dissulfurirhabdus thermomarina TaxID=1765737 RepID=A0A6N9TNU2_DISTH|nr:PilW family protein [Dissulfurirhabdus thermomarina]NDY42718.1 prepilin-type N-terminal cleavage/methylation domain-containing protein [Dissulfurirhabdus thermomarina]NMX23630.1 prepilin-type N-terminal cleavage/methylation domain-containing protein [Dissulfurirhabdus thermomarina]